ncbi:hypothetical protein ACVNIS_14080 [Sphaerotilaceae bacterium SBD11-9]
MDYYGKVSFGDASLFILDDASPYTPPQSEVRLVREGEVLTGDSAIPQLLRFNQHLGRLAHDQMHGWWRSFLYSLVVARAIGANKIVHIESDAYILSQRLLDYVTGMKSGWAALWTERFRMPETAIQVICEDQFEKLEAFRQRKQHELDGLMAEKILPFSDVNRSFIGDRYSETRAHRGILKSSRFNGLPIFKHDFFWAKIPANADFVTQLIPNQVLRSSLCQPSWVPPSPMPPRDMQLRRNRK